MKRKISRQQLKLGLFFTSDSHFGHDNIRKFCKRPFEDLHDMHKNFTENWNNVVGENSIVVHAGDLSLTTNFERYIEQLNGNIILVQGNHDNVKESQLHHFDLVCDLLDLTIDKKYFVTVCHYPMLSWNKSHHGAWQLHGHTHTSENDIRDFRMSVGVDANNYTPISWEDIVQKFEEYKNNLE